MFFGWLPLQSHPPFHWEGGGSERSSLDVSSQDIWI